MKAPAYLPALLAIIAGTLTGCSPAVKSHDVSDSVRKALDQAGLTKVSIHQDARQGIVTLGGQVEDEPDKARAEAIAKSFAQGEIVLNQILVTPPGAESGAASSDLDRGIASNLDAALIQDRLHETVQYAVTNGVVTLTGEVDTQSKRRQAETAAAGVPNVLQVVNKVRIRGQKIWRKYRNN